MTNLRCRAIVIALLLVAGRVSAQPQPPAPIRYTVRFPAPQTNYLDVEALVPTDGRATVEMLMAVWTPGSYLVREYERNVEDVRAFDGAKALAIEKPLKNRWRIATGGAHDVRLTYRVYSHEMTVRNNWVEADFAMMNGSPTFMTIASDVEQPRPGAAAAAGAGAKAPAHKRVHDVTLELPAAWKTSMTGLPNAPDGRPHHYVAPDFDTLVDSAIPSSIRSPSRASRTFSSTSQRGMPMRCSTASARRAISSGSSKRTSRSGARCRTTSTSSSTSSQGPAASSTRTR
jgi:predicted metalloprotease with PDZ domain